jgi:hypothetical protein
MGAATGVSVGAAMGAVEGAEVRVVQVRVVQVCGLSSAVGKAVGARACVRGPRVCVGTAEHGAEHSAPAVHSSLVGGTHGSDLQPSLSFGFDSLQLH